MEEIMDNVKAEHFIEITYTGAGEAKNVGLIYVTGVLYALSHLTLLTPL